MSRLQLIRRLLLVLYIRRILMRREDTRLQAQPLGPMEGGDKLIQMRGATLHLQMIRLHRA